MYMCVKFQVFNTDIPKVIDIMSQKNKYDCQIKYILNIAHIMDRHTQFTWALMCLKYEVFNPKFQGLLI